MASWNARANDIFAAAVELEPSKRPAYLEQVCGADGELKKQVEALLAALERAGSFLDGPAPGEWLSPTTLPVDSDSGRPAAGSPATRLPERYQVEGEVARGGMGAVLRGRDTRLGREIALKVMLESHQGRTDLMQRFVEEARIAGQLQHPGIAPVYELGAGDGECPYFTMKLVQGQTLARLLAQRRDPAQDRPRLLKVFEQVCQTLAYAHDRHVIHRDLKPANIMVGTFGEVQVMDWGLAKILRGGGPPGLPSQSRADQEVRPHDTHAGTILGTPGYMAPEQARGEVERVDERTDVFGLGALLCEILTGKPPFSGKSDEAMRLARHADLSGAHSRLEGCTADAELILLAKRCLAAEPGDRPRHAGEVARGMTAYLESVEARLRQAELERAQAQVKAGEERKRRRLAVALAASVLLSVLLGGGGYTWVWQQRAARRAETARRVEGALERAAVLRDRSGWAEAQAEVKRAKDLLEQGEADADLQARVAALGEEVEQGLIAAEAERRLVARLEEVRGEAGDSFDLRRAERRYAEAFRAFGLDLDGVEPAQAAVRLMDRPGTAEIAAALDHWWAIRRTLRRQDPSAPDPDRLAAVVRLTDPDPWRNGLRSAAGRRPVAPQTLKELANDQAALSEQPAASLVLLADLLLSFGEGQRGASVLRAAWRRFPGDFWINYRLGHSTRPRGRLERSGEFLRCMTAAVVARPGSSVAHTGLGLALAEQGKLEEAVAELREAIRLDPKNALVHGSLGTALGMQGQWEAARAAFREALRLDPTSSLPHASLGSVLEKQGKQDEALASYRQAIVLDPQNATAHDYLAIVLYKQGKEEEALVHVRRAIAIDPQLASAHETLGHVFAKQGKRDEALAAFRTAIALDPKRATAHNNLGLCLFELGQVDDAIAAYRQAIALDAKLAMAHFNLGIALTRKGKPDEALASYQEAIRLGLKHARAFSNYGALLEKQGKWDDALAAYRKALEINPKHAPAHNNMGFVLRKQGKLEEAIAFYRRAIALDPKHTLAYQNLGMALSQLGQVDEAIAAFREAARHDPTTASTHYNLGILLSRKGKLDEAITCYRRAIKADPRKALAYGNLGNCLAKKGELIEAVAAHRRAIALEPKHAPFHLNLGLALSRQGKPDEALSCYRLAVALQPTFALAHGKLGETLLQRDRFSEAAVSLRRTLELLPQGDRQRRVAATLLQRCLHGLKIEKTLPDVLAGKRRPTSGTEWIDCARRCAATHRTRAAVRLFLEGFAADPKLASALVEGHRIVAIRCAVREGGSPSSEAEPLALVERLRWRRQALTWLRAELALHRRQMHAGNPETSRQALLLWQKDRYLAAVRDRELLAKLSAEERQACEKLWADVETLLRQTK